MASDPRLYREAKALHDMGWCITPGKNKSKIPVLKGWNARPFPTRKEIEEWFKKKNYSVSVRLGTASKIKIEGMGEYYLYVLDCETDEAVDAVLKAAPELASGVKVKGKKGMHFYLVSGEEIRKIQLMDKEGKLQMELLGQNCRATLPPSTHPSGIEYDWHNGHSPECGYFPTMIDPTEIFTQLARENEWDIVGTLPKTSQDIGQFIFDEDKVLKDRIFPFAELGKYYGVGVLLPKKIENYSKRGELIGSEQAWVPVVITSDRKNALNEIGKDFQKKFNINYSLIPTSYPRRWSLASIEKYVRDPHTYQDITARGIFDKIYATYKKYYFLHTETWYAVHALWDIGTYFFLLFDYYPLLELRGMHGTGKNKLMAISRSFTFNATEEMTNPSEATLFRLTDEQRPTKYIDEAEKLFQIGKGGKVEADGRVELINSSFKRTGNVPRQEKDPSGRFRTVWYSTYSPTCISSINGLFGATEDRAITHVTTRAPEVDNRAQIEPDEHDPAYQEIRDQLYVFALQNAQNVKEVYSTMDAEIGLKSRDYFLWRPLLTLAKMIDAEPGEKNGGISLYDQVLTFAKKITAIKKMSTISEGTNEFRMLTVVHELLKTDYKIILFKDIQEAWSNKYGSEYIPHPKTIAKHLDRMGLQECKEHTERGNGYVLTLEQFQKIITPLVPSLFSSSSSFPSGTEGKKEKEAEAT